MGWKSPELKRAYNQRPEIRNRSNLLRRLRRSNDMEYKKKEQERQHLRYVTNPVYRQQCLERARKWHQDNPKSSRRLSLNLQEVMWKVRKRDKNTCRWSGCGLSHRESIIHVHHIFPRKEYPELQLIEKYMICYCANHHGLWHRYRGDPYANLILSQKVI